MSRRDETRRFATILFTDIVGSTDIARELGDLRWREIVRRHHAIVRRELKRFDGHEVDTAGDGFFAIFDGPGTAIRCAVAITEGVREVGLEVRAGLHAGEVVASDGKAGGIAVNIGARVMAVAGYGEVLVSQTLRDLVAGSPLGFTDHGVHTLKGIDGEWRLSLVSSVDGDPVAEPLDGAEAARRRLAIEPSVEPQRRRRRLVLGGVAVVTIVAAGTFAVLSRDDPDPVASRDTPLVTGPEGPSPGSLVKLDARTGEPDFVRAGVPGSVVSGVKVNDLDVGLGSGWLTRVPVAMKVDPEDGSTSNVTGNEGDVAAAMAVGADAVWVVGRYLWPVDPATGVAGEPIDYLPRDETFLGASDLVEAFGRIWISSNAGSVIEVDPATRTPTPIEIGDTPDGIVAGTDTVWVLDAAAPAISRIDPRTSEPLEPISFSGAQDEVAIGGGFVWVLDGDVGTLTPVDESTGDVRAGIDVGTNATDVVFGLDVVWVSVGGDVVEIDPTTHRVIRTIEVGETPIASLAFDETDGSLWLDIAARG